MKVYGEQDEHAAGRYSPSQVIDVRMDCVRGFPFPDRVCTSHIERHNLSIRMGVKRMSRLTIAFSKKWENHEYQLALFFLYYNFCRVHSSIKATLAVKAGLTDHQWTVEKLLNDLATRY